MDDAAGCRAYVWLERVAFLAVRPSTRVRMRSGQARPIDSCANGLAQGKPLHSCANGPAQSKPLDSCANGLAQRQAPRLVCEWARSGQAHSTRVANALAQARAFAVRRQRLDVSGPAARLSLRQRRRR